MRAAAPTAVAQAWTSRARLSNGKEICIRPLRPDDREREIAFINALSERSRYFRLFTPLKFLPPHLLDQLMDIDFDRRMALVATVMGQDGEQFVGIARYAVADCPGSAEIGVTVADQWHRNGIARLLILELMRFARARAIRRFTGIVLPENQAMLALARSTGFSATYDSRQHIIGISCELNAQVE
jgi:RimJ/RimL family protein N-acetyltransferase